MPRAADIRTDRGTSAASGAGDLASVGAVPAAFAAGPLVTSGEAHSDAPAGAASHLGSTQLFSQPASDTQASHGLMASTSPGALSAAQSGAPAQQIMAPVIVEGLPAVSHDGQIAFAAAMGANGSPAIGEALPAAAAVAGGNSSTAVAGSGDAAAPAAATGPTLDEMRDTVASLQETVAQLASDLGSARGNPADVPNEFTVAARDDVGDTLDRVEARLDGIVDSATSLTAPLLDNVSDTLDGVEARLDGIADSATSLTAPLLDNLSESVGAAVDGATRVADAGVAQAAQITSEVTAIASHAVQGAAGLADGILDDAISDDGIVGADPVAGVATLVGMVSAADAFGLHDAGVADDILSQPLGVLGTADLLADAAPADALLGITDDDGLLGGLSGLGDHGLFGHG